MFTRCLHINSARLVLSWIRTFDLTERRMFAKVLVVVLGIVVGIQGTYSKSEFN